MRRSTTFTLDPIGDACNCLVTYLRKQPWNHNVRKTRAMIRVYHGLGFCGLEQGVSKEKGCLFDYGRACDELLRVEPTDSKHSQSPMLSLAEPHLEIGAGKLFSIS